MRTSAKQRRLIALTFLTLASAVVSAQTRAAGLHQGTKRALIVAIGAYPEPSVLGYPAINAHNDVPLIREALLHQGFLSENITVLQDEAANREGLLAAFDALLQAAGPDDIAVLHYSGHGDQITDDNGDELDGYDEVLVPYGAPARSAFEDHRAAAAYTGDWHIRDDLLGAYLERLRRKVGPGGNVTAWIDACYAGTGTRSPGAPQPRGTPEPIGPPAGTRSAVQREEAAGLFDPGSSTRGLNDMESNLAPFVAVSASRQGELNYEAKDEHGHFVGSLSLALNRALARLRPGTTYEALFDQVSVLMATLAPHQSPQLEGNIGTEVFSGRTVAQSPYYRVEAVEGDSLVTLRAGTLVGLLPGTRVAFHPLGTADPADAAEDPLATGTVMLAREVSADVRLDAVPNKGGLQESWAFVTEHGFGAMTLQVQLYDGLDPATREALQQALTSGSVVEIVDKGGDLRLHGTQQAVRLETVAGEIAVSAPLDPRSTGFVEAVREQVLNFARNQYLARVEMQDDEIDVRLTLVPATHQYRQQRCIASDTTRHGAVRRAGYWELHEGDGYLLELHNRGTQPAYVAVLDLLPDGDIQQLFPLPYLSRDEAYLEPGQRHLIENLCYEAAPPFGNEVLKLFATSASLDFTPILSTRGASRGSVQGAGPLQQFLADVHAGTRSKVSGVPGGVGSTHAIKIRVLPRTD